MDSSLLSTQKTKLWEFAAALFEEIQREPESKDSGGRVQLKFNHVVSNLTCVRDIVAKLFEEEMLSERERDDIFILESSSPTRASEELLNVITKKDNKVYERFLKALVDTKQHHIHRLLSSEEEECSTIHSYIIRRNYTWLVDKLESSNGLVYKLYEKNVLNCREMEDIRTETNTFKKNEKLLSLSSRKDSEHFEVFLLALKDTEQMYIYAKLQNYLRSITTRPSNAEIADAPPPLTQRANIGSITAVSPNPSEPPTPPPRRKRTFRKMSVTKEIPCIREKRTSIRSLRKEMPQLSHQHQSEIALKAITVRKEKNYTTSDILDNCIVKALREFDQLKKEAQQNNQEKMELRQHLHDFIKRQQHGHKADEIMKLKKEVLTKSMEIADIRSQTERELQRLLAEVKILQQDIEMAKARSNVTNQDNKQLINDKAELEEKVNKLKTEVIEHKKVIERRSGDRNTTTEPTGLEYKGKQKARGKRLKQENKQLILIKSSLEDAVQQLKAEITEKNEVIQRLARNKLQTTDKDFNETPRLEYKDNWTLVKKIEKATDPKSDGLGRRAISESGLDDVPQNDHIVEIFDKYGSLMFKA